MRGGAIEAAGDCAACQEKAGPLESYYFGIFSASGVREIVSVPDKRPVKPVYVRHFGALVDAAKDAARDLKSREANKE